MDHRADNASGWRRRSPTPMLRAVSLTTRQTTAGKADRPALTADTLAAGNTGIPNAATIAQ